MFSHKKTASILLVIAVFLFILDRYLKYLALEQKQAYNLLGNIFRFNLAKNYNIAFSLPISGWFLIFLIIIILVFLLFYSLQLVQKQDWLRLLLLTNIQIGAISNLIDRFKYGYVIDYFDLKYFTIFNLADTMISLSIFSLFIWEIRNGRKRDSSQGEGGENNK